MLLFIFLLGLLLGSFLNVCIYRIPREESIAFPPSHCTSCKNRIRYFDLIPVVSYLFLGGKCRYCGEKISVRYPLVELFTALTLALIYMKYGLSFELAKYSLLVLWLIVIGMIDFDTTDIYFKTTASGILLAIVFIIVGYYYGYDIWQFVFGGILGGGVITLIVLLTGGMGWGDVEVFLLGGLFIGLKLTLVALLLSFVLGGLIGALLILTKKKTRKDYIPFAPFISLGLILAVLVGDKLVKLYIG